MRAIVPMGLLGQCLEIEDPDGGWAGEQKDILLKKLSWEII
jgi:hypothetical protein